MKIQWAAPWLDGREKDELVGAFDSTWLSMGPRTKRFEERMAAYIGVKHAIAVSNGTDALDLALKAMGVGPGDEVIVPAMTYIATVSSVLYQNAKLVFADIERDSYNLDAASAERLVTKKTKCILYIDYGGNPADHPALKSLSERTGVPLLQDGAQSLGGEYGGAKLCRQGAVCTTSFHTAKLMTTIEGGMIFTEDDAMAAHMRMMRNQGEDPERKYVHPVLGTNARMTDMQAAIGLRQLDKFDVILEKRRRIAERYYARFAGNPGIVMPKVRPGGLNSWFFAPILVENRDAVAKALKGAGVDTRVAYPMPAYEQPFYARYAEPGVRIHCPNAKWMTERVLNLPMFHEMTDAQLDYVTEQTLSAVARNPL